MKLFLTDTAYHTTRNILKNDGAQQYQFTIFNYHVYRHGVYGVYIDIIIYKVITIRHERIITRHK